MGSDPPRTARDDFVSFKAIGYPLSWKLSPLIGLLTYCGSCLLAAQVHAQQTDQFITTIEKIKTGIAPVACARAAAPTNFDVGVHGTAFFIDAHGAFLTAAHVIIAGYQVVEMGPKHGLHLRMLVLDKPA